ncbi:extracellular solute-binding protein [Endozoicomonas sp. SM1973]|uniref:Extracellular solute-binding protein n=1 Tax=Spartinivicinus marinus TaxID=2994442 RepID=A0A853IB39_9GAMM|nr:extracellular solute-binding protein [Spartinivicinus marinus]MCX4026391.1 extracellular solute-binding protein [Spartinivicinus marinus]NYZ67264.1 extracellular solute-binding protein [Spartinivicinus marinus]
MTENIVRFAASEQEPYIGQNLLNNGYVAELVKEVYSISGYKTDIKFYPLARARELAKQGKVDGLLPFYQQHTVNNVFVLSNPFPGSSIGLIKKKSLQIAKLSNLNDLSWHKLVFQDKYKFGAVRGTEDILSSYSEVKTLKLDLVSSDIQNIDKIIANRIDFAVIDKYTAADLLINKRPHFIGKLEFMPPPLLHSNFYVAFSTIPENVQKNKRIFDKGLKVTIDNGGLTKIMLKHGFMSEEVSGTSKQKLTIGTVNNNDMVVMKRLSKHFEAMHPNIKLEWRILDEDILRKRLMGDLAIADGQFDVMTIGTYETPIWAKRNWLTPLHSFPKKYDINDIIENVKKSLSYQDALYALPFYAESSVTYYRTDLLKKLNIKMPLQPTYEEIKQIAAKVHNPAEQIYGICLRGKAGWGGNMALLSTMVNTYNGQWFDTKWLPTLNTTPWHEAVSMYKNLIINYGPPEPINNNFVENLALFANGQCGIWIDATVAAGLLFNPKYSKVYDKLGIANAPIAKTSKGANWLWSWALAIPASSHKKEAAFKFITWATSKDYIKLVAQQEGWVSVPPGTRKSTYQNKDYLQAAPFAKFVFNAIQSADPHEPTLTPSPYIGIQYVGIPEFPAIGHQISLKLVEVLKGRIEIDRFLKESQAIAKQQMQHSGYILH